MNESPLLSVIVPVYNAIPFLEKCLSSIENQGIPENELEIICVDDGSTDGSGAWLDKHALKHDNVKVIHKTNGGECFARNCGLDEAKGKYIEFVDSDDALIPNTLYDIVKEMDEKSCAVAQFEYIELEQDSPNKLRMPANHKPKTYVAPMVLSGAVWKYIFSREKFGLLRFDEGLHFAGDTFYVQTVALNTPMCLHSTKVCYIYNKTNPKSVMTKRDFLDVAKNMMRLANNLKRYLDEKTYPNEMEQAETWCARASAGYIYYSLRGGQVESPFKILKDNGLWPYRKEWKLLLIHIWGNGGLRQTISNYCLFFVGFRPVWWFVHKCGLILRRPQTTLQF